MTRRLFVLYFLVALCPLRVDAGEKPNVLFLAVDDMNDWIGCLETTPRAITPNIERLAASGVSFTNAHTAGVFCAISRAAIFSERYASTTGCYQTSHYYVGHPEIEALQMSFRCSERDLCECWQRFGRQERLEVRDLCRHFI